MGASPIQIDREQIVRLWLHRQGLAEPRGTRSLTARRLTDHLERTGALQQDSVNVVDRAHYLTVWSRFGMYDRRRMDRWIYRDRIAYEYWGHEASILPISHLPLGLRRMRRFPPDSWKRAAWWSRYATSPAVKRLVIRRLRDEGKLESADFEKGPNDAAESSPTGVTMPLMKETKRALQLLWHAGKVAVDSRRHFRRVYDLAERVYTAVEASTTAEYHDSWLLIGLSGNGVASPRDLDNYMTAPRLGAVERSKVIARHLRKGTIIEVRADGVRGPLYALPEHLDGITQLDEPHGTTLICPFDSLLWQRQRAEHLLDFTYRVEIYTPPKKRQFGYYVMPILHDGRLVGRLDPKLHREQESLEIKSLVLEPAFKRNRRFDRELDECVEDLAGFLGARRVRR